MRFIYLVILVMTLPVASSGQNVPTQLFEQWASGHVHSIGSADQSAGGDSDLEPLRKIIGTAQMVALGEPLHGAHEPLAMRNRVIRYAVNRLGLTAVALETDLTSSQRLYNYVLGKSAETDSALEEAFTLGFGEYPENLELLHWLRAHNAAESPARQVHFYGVDLFGQFYPYAYRSVEAVLTFLDRTDPALGRALRKQYADVILEFRSDRYPKLPQTEKDAITGKIQDLLALIRRERVPLIAASSSDEYDWTLRQAINAAEDDTFLRCLPAEFGDLERFRKSPELSKRNEGWEHNHEMREVAMASSLEWVYQRESPRGKILFFAHDVHVQTSIAMFGSPKHPSIWPVQQSRMAGMFLRSVLDSNLVVIGTHFGHGRDFRTSDAPLPPDANGMDALLASLSIPQFIMDIRELPSSGPLHEWFNTLRETRGLGSGKETRMETPPKAYDAILFIDTITPTPAPQRR
jgi:erythromycin esterase